MAKFIIQPHGRLQEWIADEMGYFRDAGLDYEFVRGPSADTRKKVDAGGKVTDLLSGAFESLREGRRQQGRQIRYFMRVPLGGQPGLGATGWDDVGQILCRHAGRHHGAAGIAHRGA